jgi:hypothetical protein
MVIRIRARLSSSRRCQLFRSPARLPVSGQVPPLNGTTPFCAYGVHSETNASATVSRSFPTDPQRGLPGGASRTKLGENRFFQVIFNVLWPLLGPEWPQTRMDKGGR